ncbi:uncharacterized protein [Watersipora subatra]|uniref:uncharacterized protein n=1 Tax=Watersipora subatra TaxID=2589382 RepID=UPI00355BBA8D
MNPLPGKTYSGHSRVIPGSGKGHSRLFLASKVMPVLGKLFRNKFEQSEIFIVGRIAQIYQGKPFEFVLKGKLSADYINGMEAIVETITDAESGKFVTNNTELRVKDATYLIDNVNQACTKKDGTPVIRLCTDSSRLKYIDSWRMGTQMTDTYLYDDHTVNGKLIMTMFRDSFTQAASVVDQTFQGVRQQVSLLYGNQTMGIQDPTVFKIPSFCN